MADTGEMRVLARAGNNAAARLATMPIAKPVTRPGQDMEISVTDVRKYNSDTVWPTAPKADFAKRMPTPRPSKEPTIAMTAVSPRKSAMIWPRVVPRARRMPISFLRCTTDMETAL